MENKRESYRRGRVFRADFWDYSFPACYFVTLNVSGRLEKLGEVRDKKMTLSFLGKIAFDRWTEIPKHYPHIVLDEFQFMPDHLHGILIIPYSHTIYPNANNFPFLKDNMPELGFHSSEARFQHPGKKSISSAIGSFKSAVTRQAHLMGFDFAWQRRFHDRIIRNRAELETIRTYIRNNPKNWTP